MTQNHVPLTARQTAKNAQEPLLALAGLLARLAAKEDIERDNAEQLACTENLPTDIIAPTDV
jgi:hypothetical protein